MTGKDQESEMVKNVASTAPKQEGLPPEIVEVLNELPDPQRKEVTRMIASFSMISRSSPEGEIAKKITPDHISTMLEAQQKGMDYTYKDRQHQKIFFVAILLIVIVAVIVIIMLLKDNPEAMMQILTALISATLGAAGGYGIGAKKRDDD